MTPSPSFSSIIDKYYPAGTRLRDIFISHSRAVADLALAIAHSRHLPLEDEDIEGAAMLHDVGIFLTDARGIECCGSEPYIRHGILGAELLRREGMPEAWARVAERHTGSGLTAREIADQDLPLPQRDFLPETLLERLICYADKFYSKSGDGGRKDIDGIRRSLSKKSAEAALRFDALVSEFGLPD